jgi:small-conductance mechanosensitive channel
VWMQAMQLPLGKTPVSLWVLLSGTMSVIITLLVTLWICSALEARLMRARSVDMNLRVVLARIGRGFMVLVALLLGLSFAGLDLTLLSVFGGALGVGLGLGLQKIASNYVSGFIILLDRSLRIGDLVSVDKFYGAVARINTRYTVLKGVDGTEAIVPNEMLVALPVTNHSRDERRVRLAFKVFLRYGADLQRALRTAVEEAAAHPLVLREPGPTALLLGYTADNMEIEVGCWIRDAEAGVRTEIQSAIAVAIHDRFRAEAIGAPFPAPQPTGAG